MPMQKASGIHIPEASEKSTKGGNVQLSDRITVKSVKKERPSKELKVRFDDPPGPSPARMVVPIREVEAPVSSLRKALDGKVSALEAGGVSSHAYTGESYVIVIFVLSGIVGGILGAIGQDVWRALKRACSKIINSNSARRNVVEVALEFGDMDVILHYESRNPSKLADMFSTADSILEELKDALARKPDLIRGVKTIELRLKDDGKSYNCVFYSYRRCRKIIQMQSKKDDS